MLERIHPSRPLQAGLLVLLLALTAWGAHAGSGARPLADARARAVPARSRRRASRSRSCSTPRARWRA